MELEKIDLKHLDVSLTEFFIDKNLNMSFRYGSQIRFFLLRLSV